MKSNLILLLILIATQLSAQERIDLSGTWNFKLDKDSIGVAEKWYNQDLQETIYLPGTTDQAKYGEKTIGSDFGILTRAYKYYGPAWYQKRIEIPKEWRGKRVFLNLERVMWQSKVFIDGNEISTQDALSTPHMHDLGLLPEGTHILTVCINNDMLYNIGDKGHVYTEYTQSIWNGAVGKIELIAKDLIRFSNPQVYTHINPKMMEVKDLIVNETDRKQNVVIEYNLKERKTGYSIFTQSDHKLLNKGNNELILVAEMPTNLKLWDDVHPNLYELEITIRDRNKTLDSFKEEIGFREISTSKSKILVNGKPVFLRGNLDCVHFPLTGYPSCDPTEWERIFKIYKDYGLNHVRFHSWCPPKAAFTAADRLGLYIQAEVIWLDWWMAIKTEGREEMWTKGLPDGLGKNPSADEYSQKELKRMLDVYGNHASFAMQCIGNELGNSDFDVMESWMKPLKESDSRRLYSLSTARTIKPIDQYMATHYLPNIGSTRGLKGGASTDWDFEEIYSQSDIPIIAHEIGQWPVYPKWDEIKKYKGVLKARNFEEFREQARKNKIENQNDDFVAASGALNQILYKYEIESFLRTPSCAGIQLLSMQDYQGQGEALVGWLDVFYDSKGITTPEKFKCHHDTTVTLLRMPKYVWEADEIFEADIQLAHYGTSDINDGVYWQIKDERNNVLTYNEVQKQVIERGSSKIIGKINHSLKNISEAKKLTIDIGLMSSPIKNSWDIWVYPKNRKIVQNKVHTTNRLDAEAIKILKDGGKVLLDASSLGTEYTADMISFYPLYWSLTFFPGQGKNTIGMHIQDKHPLFNSFPTSSHSDWQWEKIYKNARAFYINDFPEAYKPIAQPIDDFHRNNKLASIFEMRVGKGKLLICGFNLSEQNNPVAGQLKESMLNYMNTEQFDPEYDVSVETVTEMFKYIEPLKSITTQEFENPTLYIDCAVNAEKSEDREWNNTLDKLSITKESTYEAIIEGVYKSNDETAWLGKEISFDINCPAGIIGTLYVCFIDETKNGYSVDILFEGRFFKLSKIEDGKAWVKMHIMREDSNDGVLKFTSKSVDNKNLMISQIAIIED